MSDLHHAWASSWLCFYAWKFDLQTSFDKAFRFAAKLLAPSCTAPSIRCARTRNVCLTPSAVVVVAFLPTSAWCDLMAASKEKGAWKSYLHVFYVCTMKNIKRFRAMFTPNRNLPQLLNLPFASSANLESFALMHPLKPRPIHVDWLYGLIAAWMKKSGERTGHDTTMDKSYFFFQPAYGPGNPKLGYQWAYWPVIFNDQFRVNVSKASAGVLYQLLSMRWATLMTSVEQSWRTD